MNREDRQKFSRRQSVISNKHRTFYFAKPTPSTNLFDSINSDVLTLNSGNGGDQQRGQSQAIHDRLQRRASFMPSSSGLTMDDAAAVPKSRAPAIQDANSEDEQSADHNQIVNASSSSRPKVYSADRQRKLNINEITKILTKPDMDFVNSELQPPNSPNSGTVFVYELKLDSIVAATKILHVDNTGLNVKRHREIKCSPSNIAYAIAQVRKNRKYLYGYERRTYWLSDNPSYILLHYCGENERTDRSSSPQERVFEGVQPCAAQSPPERVFEGVQPCAAQSPPERVFEGVQPCAAQSPPERVFEGVQPCAAQSPPERVFEGVQPCAAQSPPERVFEGVQPCAAQSPPERVFEGVQPCAAQSPPERVFEGVQPCAAQSPPERVFEGVQPCAAQSPPERVFEGVQPCAAQSPPERVFEGVQPCAAQSLPERVFEGVQPCAAQSPPERVFEGVQPCAAQSPPERVFEGVQPCAAQSPPERVFEGVQPCAAQSPPERVFEGVQPCAAQSLPERVFEGVQPCAAQSPAHQHKQRQALRRMTQVFKPLATPSTTVVKPPTATAWSPSSRTKAGIRTTKQLSTQPVTIPETESTAGMSTRKRARRTEPDISPLLAATAYFLDEEEAGSQDKHILDDLFTTAEETAKHSPPVKLVVTETERATTAPDLSEPAPLYVTGGAPKEDESHSEDEVECTEVFTALVPPRLRSQQTTSLSVLHEQMHSVGTETDSVAPDSDYENDAHGTSLESLSQTSVVPEAADIDKQATSRLELETGCVPYYLRDRLGKGEAEEDEVQMTPLDTLLHVCDQQQLVPWSKVFSKKTLISAKKLGEGVYGEVFRMALDEQTSVAVKIIPIEGSFLVNDERQKTCDEILPEILIAKEMSDLATRPRSTKNFVQVHDVHVVTGAYPRQLRRAWDTYNATGRSENDHPSVFPNDQLFVAIVLADAGCELEQFQFSSPTEACSVIGQLILALAVAESELCFEHRDLHIGNVLLKRTDDLHVTYMLDGMVMQLLSFGLHVHIIDFTNSRLTKEGCTLFTDLSTGDAIFQGHGDYQFDIYRMMKERNQNKWNAYHAKSNVFWLHYVCDKFCNTLLYNNRRLNKWVGSRVTPANKRAVTALRALLADMLSHDSSVDVLLHSDAFDSLLDVLQMST